MDPKPPEPKKLSADQVNGQIADKEAQLEQIRRNHQQMVQDFNRQSASNEQQASQLVGAIAALKDLVGTPAQAYVEHAARGSAAGRR